MIYILHCTFTPYINYILVLYLYTLLLFEMASYHSDTRYTNSALVYSIALYCTSIAMAVMVALALARILSAGEPAGGRGRPLHDIYTLNFQPSESEATGAATVWRVLQLVIDYYLALYPVFTISASFPIICVTLRNTLHDMCTACYRWLFSRCDWRARSGSGL